MQETEQPLTESTHRSGNRRLGAQLVLEQLRSGLGLTRADPAIKVDEAGRYSIRRQLGAGGMGVVYLAHDAKLERLVALKLVHRSDSRRAQLEARLLREARVLANFRDHNILVIHDIGTAVTGDLYIATEYVDGPTLRDWQQNRRLSELVDAYLQAGAGLSTAHQHGVVHRDFKPDNVLVVPGSPPRVLVGDFGLAGPAELGAESMIRDGIESDGLLLGTWVYMAPEQQRREPATPKSDQFAFCVALWEAVTAARPWSGAADGVVPARPANMPRWLYRIASRGLHADPNDRHESLANLLEAIVRVRRRRQALAWTMSLMVVATLVGLVGYAYGARPPTCTDAGAAIEDIWTTAARAELQQAFASVEHVDADRVATFVTKKFDESVELWREAQRITCRRRALEPGGPGLERTQACLERARLSLARELQRLSEVDLDSFSNIHGPIVELHERISQCSEAPMPLSVELEDALEEAHRAELIGDLQLAARLGDGALTLARRVARPCRAPAAYSRELAFAHYRLGHIRGQIGDTEAAEHELRLALGHAVACDEQLLLGEIATYLGQVLAIDRERPEAATLLLDMVRARLAESSEPPVSLRRSELLKAEGFVELVNGRPEAAVEAYRAALSALGDIDDHPLRAAKLLDDIGSAWAEAGRHADASDNYEHARELIASTLGTHHPLAREHSAWVAFNRSLLAYHTGDLQIAQAQLQQALAGGPPPLQAKALSLQLQLSMELERVDELSTQASRLLELLDQHPGLPARVRAESLTFSGQALVVSGDEEGLEVLDRACDLWASEFPHDPNRVGCTLILVGSLDAFGRHEQARAKWSLFRELNHEVAEEYEGAVRQLERQLSAP